MRDTCQSTCTPAFTDRFGHPQRASLADAPHITPHHPIQAGASPRVLGFHRRSKAVRRPRPIRSSASSKSSATSSSNLRPDDTSVEDAALGFSTIPMAMCCVAVCCAFFTQGVRAWRWAIGAWPRVQDLGGFPLRGLGQMGSVWGTSPKQMLIGTGALQLPLMFNIHRV